MLREQDSFWAASRSAWLSWYFCFHSATTWSDRNHQSIRMARSSTLLSLYVYVTRTSEAWHRITKSSLLHIHCLWQSIHWDTYFVCFKGSYLCYSLQTIGVYAPKLTGRCLVSQQLGHNVVSLNEAVWACLLFQDPVLLHSAHQQRSCYFLLLSSAQPCRPCSLAHLPISTTYTGLCNITWANSVEPFSNVIKGSEGWNWLRRLKLCLIWIKGWKTSTSQK